MFRLKLKKYESNIHSLEVVVRRSETQLQVRGNLNYSTWRARVKFPAKCFLAYFIILFLI